MKKISLFLSIVFSIIIVYGCSDDSVDPKDEQKIGWVVGASEDNYGTILYTTDGGQNWTRQGDKESIPDILLQGVKALDKNHAFILGENADNYPVLLKTTDAGNNWERLGSSSTMPDIEFSGFCICSLNEIWMVGYNTTIIFSKDGGITWNTIAPELDHPYQFASIVKNNKKIWVCGNHPNYGGIIIHSTDDGNTWETQGDQEFLGQPDTHGLIDISAASDTHIWTVGHNRTILHTSDGGKDWNIQKTQDGSNVDANGCCAVNEQVCFDVEDMGMIYYTDDKGENWNKQNPPSIAGAYFLYRVSAISESEAWVVGPCQMPPFDGIILYTSDKGNTWTRQTTNSAAAFSDVSFVGSNR